MSTPTRRTAPTCCACAVNGHATADTAIPVMKSRRRIAFPKGQDHADCDCVQLQQGFATGEMGFRGHFAWQQSSGPNVRFGSKADMAHLFDHLFGGGEELRTDFKSERLRGLEINRELKFGGLHNRQFARLLAVENPTDVNSRLAISVRYARSITHQATARYIIALRITRRQRMTRCQRDDLLPFGEQERAGTN